MKPKQSELHGRRTTSHLLRVCLLPLLAAVLWGCKQQPNVAADINPTGTYTLVSINGKQVPCTVNHEGASPTIKSGTFVINSDGTCSSKVSFSMPSGADSS